MAGTPRPLNATSGIAGVNGSGMVYQDGDLMYLILEPSTRMQVFLRTRTELWTDFVDREAGPLGLTLVVNGNQFQVANQLTYRMGWDPMAASETTLQGRVVDSQATLGGLSRPQHFYVACDLGPVYGYEFGQGDPPSAGHIAAVGGLGPLVIGGLKYGVGNVYKPGKSGPADGDPPGGAGDLVQRNNNTYKSIAGNSATQGKLAIGQSDRHKKVVLAVLPNGVGAGISLDALRDKLFDIGCENAVFLDGSDSVALKAGGTWHAKPGANKNRGNTIAVGFAV